MSDLLWESAAERIAPPEGWACRKCHRWYGEEERLARYCCHTSKPCDSDGCAGRAERGRTICEACRDKRDDEKWFALKKEPLPDDLSERPVVTWMDDRFFFDRDDLLEYADEHQDARFELCRRVSVPTFEMNEYLADCSHEDADIDTSYDPAINALIELAAPRTWEGSGVGVDPESVAAALLSARPADSGKPAGATP